MINQYVSAVMLLQHAAWVDKTTVNRFIHRIKQGKLIKEDNPDDHLCSFFLPIHRPSKSVFLGYHIKANDWIPPGGHIDRGESPIDTVYREFVEELKYTLTDEQVTPLDLTIKPIVNNPRHNCKLHYDFWYLVHMKEKIDFDFTKSEFYEARWMRVHEAQNLMNNHEYKEIVHKLRSNDIL